jgi:cytochrome P450
MTGLDSFDPLKAREEFIDHDLMATLRAECPVVKLPSGPYFVSRYEDVATVLRDGGLHCERFSHEGKYRDPGVFVPEEERLLVELEGRRHAILRKLVNSALHPRLVASMEPEAVQIANALIDQFVDRSDVDLVAAYADPLPSRVFARLIGIPEEDELMLRGWSLEFVSEPHMRQNRTEKGESLADALPEFSAYINALCDDRAKHPRDDLFTHLLEAEEDGVRLNRSQILATLATIVAAAQETTTTLIGNLLYRMAADPQLYERLRADPALVNAAVEESLRVDAPTMLQGRTTVDTFEMRGVKIASGAQAVLGLSSANHDEAVFENPHEFQLDRANARRHVSFGGGPHFCPGASLSRLDARVGATVFLQRIEKMELSPTYVRRKKPIFFTSGAQTLDVRIG